MASGWNRFHAYAVLRHSAVVDSFIALPKVAGRHKSRFRDRVQKNNQKRIKALNPNVEIAYPYSEPQAHFIDTPPPFLATSPRLMQRVSSYLHVASPPEGC